jgi:hypothetical protein
VSDSIDFQKALPNKPRAYDALVKQESTFAAVQLSSVPPRRLKIEFIPTHKYITVQYIPVAHNLLVNVTDVQSYMQPCLKDLYENFKLFKQFFFKFEILR